MISELLQQLTSTQQRGLLQLQVPANRGRNYLNDWLSIHLKNNPGCIVTWFGEAENAKTPAQVTDLRIKKYQSLLGQECDVLIFDCYAGFSPDALGALSGTVRAGGLCILLTPNNEDWPQYTDPEHNRLCVEPFTAEQITGNYLSRLTRLLKHDDRVFQLSLHRPEITLSTTLPDSDMQSSVLPFGCANDDQLKAVQQILALATGTTKAAVVLEADRGRGKSTALGLAISELFRQTQSEPILVLLSSPRIDSATKVMETIAEQLSLTFNKAGLSYGSHTIKFVPPDQLSQPADLILLDEAAAIPSQLLQPLLHKQAKLVFATTIHGYEGTGRGFEYKFKPMLQKHFRDTRFLTLNEPIRWGKRDWLEPVIESILALDADLPDVSGLDITEANLRYWSPVELTNNESKLKQVFGLLVHAHYRTTPQDLRYILDGANLSVFTLDVDETSIAAALVATEGQLPEALCEQIWQGRRRPKGHLLPQSLMAHGGLIDAGGFRYGRIVRITVHPELQSEGLGRHFLHALSGWGQDRWDMLGTSFGTSLKLVNFWLANDFLPVRFGVQQEASTGECSLLMVKPLQNSVKSKVMEYFHRLEQTLMVEQNARFRANQGDIISALLPITLALDTDITAQDRLDLVAFAHHFRGLENAWLALYKLSTKHPDIEILSDKFLQDLPNKAMYAKYHFSGEKQLVTRLRDTVGKLI